MFSKWKRRLKKHGRRGLTLVELAIVVLVLGVIMGIVFYNLRGTATDVMTSAKKLQVAQFQANQLPRKLDEFRDAGGDVNPGQDLTILLQEIPESSYKPAKEELIMDPWGRPYFICQGEDGTDRICSLGRDGREGGEGENADFQLDDERTWPDWLKKK
jgi:general secretion pathway protein G